MTYVSGSLLQQFQQSSQLSGGNAAYVEELYEVYLRDPMALATIWREYFDGLPGRNGGEVPHSPIVAELALAARSGSRTIIAATGQAHDSEYAAKQSAVLKLVNVFRARGHLRAALDPLGMMEKRPAPDLDPPFHDLTDADLDTEFSTGTLAAPPRMTFRAILSKLRATYAGSIGAEFMHIADAAQRHWVHDAMERAGGNYGHSGETKRRILERLTAAEGLERYLHTKYVGQKRFSLEGGDSLIPLLDEMVRRAGSRGVKEIVVGMAHRGRLNVLINTLGKATKQLFAEFEGKYEAHEDPAHSGDVKYHMGYSSDVPTPGGSVHLALGFNPSHLEIIDPVVAGSVRARQARRGDMDRNQVMPVLIHGDAAFAGQGVVMELLQMSQARGFTVGGTVHVVVNNQVGFTISRTDDARSTLYCTDVAKMVGAPVFHVNADDPEAVLFCAQLAFDFRAKFKEDVVIDLICYRRHGHNEADEPAATQPLMYQAIRSRKTTREQYAAKLETEGSIAAGEAGALADTYRRRLDEGQSVAELSDGAKHGAAAVEWSRYLGGTLDETYASGLERAKLDALGKLIATVPQGFALHSRVAKIMDDRAKMAAGALRLDWGYAETLAYASLLSEGHKLRLVGQDAARGTFFHRHAVLHDQNTGKTHQPLDQAIGDGASLTIIDSLLSEEAVMAFEYGYATTDPETLVIWEAQFGDFCNGAQVVIDQFISSGESKWGRLCGLTLFLPHGYEGQGPEHSSARLERFLQLCALNNIQVCVPTTPAQMFHMLRRQMLRRARKPLVVMTPKSMLRNKLSTSSLEDLSHGGFRNLIADSTVKGARKVERVVFCSGKVYYDLVEESEKRAINDVAIVRVEQLYPFPRQEAAAEIARFPAARDIVWCQEEPMNQGAWYQIQHHLRTCLASGHRLHYAGRPRSPAPASGHQSTHLVEQAALLEQALAQPFNGGHVTE